MNSNVHTSATSGFGFPKREEQAPPLQRKRNSFSNRTHTGRWKSFVGEALRLPQRTVWIHKTGCPEFVIRTRGANPYRDRQNFTLPRRGVQSEITKRADMKSAPTGNCEFFATPFLYSYTLCCFCFSTALILSVFLLMMQ